MTDEPIIVYADYACPFCDIGHAALESYRAERDDPLPVEWHPFDLRADQRDETGIIVEEQPKDEAYFEEAWENVEDLADQYNVEVPDDPITGTDSLPAQQLSLYFQEHHRDAWDALDEALYDAVWREQRDVSDRNVLADVATEAGLYDDVVERALADDDLRSRLLEEFEQALSRGVTGVPTFVYNNKMGRGAVPPSKLRELVEGTE